MSAYALTPLRRPIFSRSGLISRRTAQAPPTGWNRRSMMLASFLLKARCAATRAPTSRRVHCGSGRYAATPTTPLFAGRTRLRFRSSPFFMRSGTFGAFSSNASRTRPLYRGERSILLLSCRVAGDLYAASLSTTALETFATRTAFASPNIFSVLMTIHEKSTSYHVRPCRADVGCAW